MAKFECLHGHGVIEATGNMTDGVTILKNSQNHTQRLALGHGRSIVFALANAVMSECTGTVVIDDVHECFGAEQCDPSCTIWQAYNSNPDALIRLITS